MFAAWSAGLLRTSMCENSHIFRWVPDYISATLLLSLSSVKELQTAATNSPQLLSKHVLHWQVADNARLQFMVRPIGILTDTQIKEVMEGWLCLQHECVCITHPSRWSSNCDRVWAEGCFPGHHILQLYTFELLKIERYVALRLKSGSRERMLVKREA